MVTGSATAEPGLPLFRIAVIDSGLLASLEVPLASLFRTYLLTELQQALQQALPRTATVGVVRVRTAVHAATTAMWWREAIQITRWASEKLLIMMLSVGSTKIRVGC